MLVSESEILSLVYIHVPKTAGTTFRQILDQAIKDKFLAAEFNSVVKCPSPVLYPLHSDHLNPVSVLACNYNGEFSVLVNKTENSSSIKLLDNELIQNPTTKSSFLVKPCITCYDYWEISDGIDLAHLPRRYFQYYYPPPDKRTNWLPIDKSKFLWITSVRNPYSRIYSAYCWQQKQRGLPVSIADFRYLVKNKLPQIVNNYNQSFEQGGLPEAEYIHYIPMWMMLAEKDGLPKVDYIIRQENFDQDIRFLLTRLKLKLPQQYKNFHCHQGLPAQPYEYLDCYDEQSKCIIEILYQKDFHYFGYTLTDN